MPNNVLALLWWTFKINKFIWILYPTKWWLADSGKSKRNDEFVSELFLQFFFLNCRRTKLTVRLAPINRFIRFILFAAMPVRECADCNHNQWSFIALIDFPLLIYSPCREHIVSLLIVLHRRWNSVSWKNITCCFSIDNDHSRWVSAIATEVMARINWTIFNFHMVDIERTHQLNTGKSYSFCHSSPQSTRLKLITGNRTSTFITNEWMIFHWIVSIFNIMRIVIY